MLGKLVVSASAVLSLTLATAVPVGAQTTDPRDFEGTWIGAAMALFMGIDHPYTPKGQNLMADRIDAVKAGHSFASAHLTCRPTGVAGTVAPKAAFLILQTPAQMYVVSQEDRETRHVYLDTPHPANLTPTYSGDSRAHWDGDTLVVDTIGYNGHGQLDEIGNPQSDQSHVVERWTKSADGRQLTVQYTFTDPVYFTQPFTISRQFQRVARGRVSDYDCAENPRSDDFDSLTFPDDYFKPTCMRVVVKDVAADKVTCTPRLKPKDAAAQ